MGIANPSDDLDDVTDNRGFIDIFRDKRDEGRRRGFHWNLTRRVDTEFFQILAVTGLDPVARRFLIGTVTIRPNDSGGGYDGIVAGYDLEGREVWREVMSNGGVINIHDMVASAGRLYVVGSVSRYFEGLEPLGANDGFIRAYRLARPAGGGEVRAEHLWTRASSRDGRGGSHWTCAAPTRGPDCSWRPWIGQAISTLPDTPRRFSRIVCRTSGIPSPGRFSDELRPQVRCRRTPPVDETIRADAATAVRAITADCGGNVWLGGATMGVFAGERQQDGEPHGGFVVRLDADGNTTWASSSILAGRIADIDANSYYVSGLDLDPDGRLFAVGESTLAELGAPFRNVRFYLGDDFDPAVDMPPLIDAAFAPGGGAAALTIDLGTSLLRINAGPASTISGIPLSGVHPAPCRDSACD